MLFCSPVLNIYQLWNRSSSAKKSYICTVNTTSSTEGWTDDWQTKWTHSLNCVNGYCTITRMPKQKPTLNCQIKVYICLFLLNFFASLHSPYLLLLRLVRIFILGSNANLHVNSLWPSDAMWRQGFGSTLAQVMAWYGLFSENVYPA